MSNFNLTTIQGKNIVIDISELVNKEVLYINATKLALQFGKSRQNLRKFLNSKAFIEYLEAYSKVIQKSDFIAKDKEFKVNLFDYFRNGISLVKAVKGKYGGTYIHNELVIVFLRWLNVDFAVQCDMYIKQKIQQIQNDKLIANTTAEANKLNDEWLEAREKATKARNRLTDTIKSFCEYAGANRAEPYKENKCPYYIKLTNLVYKSLGIKKPKGAKSARDVFSGAVVEKINHLEGMLIKLIESNIQQETEYHEAYKSIKELINYEALLMDEVA